MNIKVTPLVRQALTTREASLECNYHFFSLPAYETLKRTFTDCAAELNLSGAKERDFIDCCTRNEVAAETFDIVVKDCSLPIYLGESERRTGRGLRGLTEKKKAGMMRALLYILGQEQEDAYNDCLNEMLKHISLVHYRSKVTWIVKEYTHYRKTISDFLTVKRIGGTENNPRHEAVFDFDGHMATVCLVGKKTKAEDLVLKEWFLKYGNEYKKAT